MNFVVIVIIIILIVIVVFFLTGKKSELINEQTDYYDEDYKFWNERISQLAGDVKYTLIVASPRTFVQNKNEIHLCTRVGETEDECRHSKHQYDPNTIMAAATHELAHIMDDRKNITNVHDDTFYTIEAELIKQAERLGLYKVDVGTKLNYK